MSPRDACASGPLSRTTPIPPRPGGVAIATMVSVVENMIQKKPRATGDKLGALVASHALAVKQRYFRAEIMTVFENASPTLSVVAPGTSATAMCTMRRSYGFSGPSC